MFDDGFDQHCPTHRQRAAAQQHDQGANLRTLCVSLGTIAVRVLLLNDIYSRRAMKTRDGLCSNVRHSALNVPMRCALVGCTACTTTPASCPAAPRCPPPCHRRRQQHRQHFWHHHRLQSLAPPRSRHRQHLPNHVGLYSRGKNSKQRRLRSELGHVNGID